MSDDTVALQNAATRFLEKWTWPPDAEAYVQYCQLHRDFFQLFRAASRFSDAFLHFQEGRHRAAMPQFINALEINSQGMYILCFLAQDIHRPNPNLEYRFSLFGYSYFQLLLFLPTLRQSLSVTVTVRPFAQ